MNTNRAKARLSKFIEECTRRLVLYGEFTCDRYKTVKYIAGEIDCDVKDLFI